MEIVIELPKDIDKLCRTCMNIVEENQRSCVATDCGDQGIDLKKMLAQFIESNQSIEEYLPKFMCKICVEKLEAAYLFRQQCQNTYMHFQEFMYPADKIGVEAISGFICSMCDESFATQYRLSKHEIMHYKKVNLLTMIKDKNDKNTKFNVNNSIEEISSLVNDRKEEAKGIKLMARNENQKAFKVNIHQGFIKQTALKSCDLCGRVFDTDLSLHLHFINHAILAEGNTDPEIFNQYFYCRTCGETFHCYEDLEDHQINCLEFNKFKCTQCNEVFDSELNLLQHENGLLHFNSEWEKIKLESTTKCLYMCPICNAIFTTKSELSMHSVRHIIKKITCRICKKTFSCETAHNNHLKSHPNYKHMCELCGRWLGSRHALKIHKMGIHSSSKNYICSVCSQAFKTPSRLYIHNLTHKKDKKFICSICNYKTNFVGDFRVHKRIHTAERPYKCNFVNCKRQFRTSSHLNEHIERHLQIKKYQCNMCYMVFGHNHTLKMHLMVHTGEKPFTCTVCKAKFRRKHHLKNHMKQHIYVESQGN